MTSSASPDFVRCDQALAWGALQGHYEAHGRDFDLREAFARDPERAQRFGLQAPEVFADLSRCPIDVAGTRLLLELAQQCGLAARRDAMLAGEAINTTEGRAVLHTALRAPRGAAPFSDPVHDELERMLAFAEGIRDVAASGIRDIVNIGIGGSDLGPQMAVPALDAWTHPGLRLHFVSNVDGHDLAQVLRRVHAHETLFVIASKTFTTQETLANAETALQWFRDQGRSDVERHFIACTAAPQVAAKLGIQTSFGFWDWVGGRYSMWSAIGLPIALAIGAEAFRDLLAGAHAMDRHFAEAPLADNLPIRLGLMDVWLRNFCGATSRCVVPYHHGLRRLPAYLQQLEMESNGKCVDLAGRPLAQATSPVVWGEPGTNGQHAFFQMLHQGTDVIPVEFVLVRHTAHAGHWSAEVLQRLEAQQQMLLANGLAQAQALMLGKTAEQARAESVPTAAADADPDLIARHRTFPGNRPSITLLLERLTPRSLGALIALYEHRVFTAGTLWGLNPFDQWGVELGKALCKDLLPRLGSGEVDGLDAATAAMVKRLR